jgi:putative ABC transport system permease protein
LRKDWLSTLNIRIDQQNLPATIRFLESTWNKLCPEFQFGYRFLDESYERLYSDEMRLGKTFIYLAILAIFIACIGLLGLSSFMAQQRTKEIGIRKTLGDTSSGIVIKFSREFAKWVIISGCIAVPVSWLIMNQWLSSFAYRIQIGTWIMAGSCLIALLVALITVYVQISRIAVRNPVEALRYE